MKINHYDNDDNHKDKINSDGDNSKDGNINTGN